jgi:hypothetical protein
MARTPIKKHINPIIAAGDRLEDEDEALLNEVDAEDDLDSDEGNDYDPNDVSVDDMLDVVERMPEQQRAQVEASRKRGGAPHQQKPVHAGRVKQETRTPRQRDRLVEWRPADTLFAPPPRPGMEQRWIRIRLGEKDDPRNFQKKFREGWKPVKLSDTTADLEPPTMAFGRFGEVIAVSDLVLCERPVEIGLSRKRFFHKKHQRQLAAADRRHVDRVQRDGHRIAGGAKADMKPTVGRGSRNRQAPVQDDNAE